MIRIKIAVLALVAACTAARGWEEQPSPGRPPHFLYHFGKYDSLIKSVHGEFPQAVWDKIAGSPVEWMQAMTQESFWLPVSDEQWLAQDVFVNMIKTAVRKDPAARAHLARIKEAVSAASLETSSFSAGLKALKADLERIP